MKKTEIVVLTIFSIVLLTASFYLITKSISKTTGYVISGDETENKFYDCLKEKNITLYINTDNITTTIDQIETKDTLEYVRVFNCIENGEFCDNQRITSFPTWIINNNKIEKDISLQELIKYSECNAE